MEIQIGRNNFKVFKNISKFIFLFHILSKRLHVCSGVFFDADLSNVLGHFLPLNRNHN